MTRASLLHILDHVNGISDTEVRELEQLAAAFPYCQTAHLLLAKAAHDRGSMLAGQRLRRAATYAADRELLRQLLEQPAAPAAMLAAAEAPVVPAPAAAAAVTAAIPAFYERETTITEPSVTPAATDTPPELLPPVYSTAEVSEAEPPTDEVTQKVAEGPVTIEPEEQPETPATTDAAVADDAAVTENIPSEPAASDEAPAISTAPADEAPGEAALNKEATPEQPAADESAAAQEDSGASPTKEVTLYTHSEAESKEQPDTSLEEPTVDVPVPADTHLLPAVAPPIRPPAEAGISRFEFGLSEPELPVPSGYQLPDLDEEEDELPTLSNLPSTPAPSVTAPFRTDKDLGYSLGAGSRLGYDLQPHDGYTLDLPLDAFFEPDALLLAHMRAHQPKPTASSLDLINQFLKTKPRIKSPVGVPLPAAEQADLSVRSLTAAPALASESLAKIMVRQGKKDKAIEIYERLMERQPEKKAYFADQIQQLQQPSE
ncbi:hypothetical protein [Hymenobacter perfusus]|uniref:Uncharacterized protein n=1 Tax=Hymenobacter perfusus TaxID=1236770 RepID=A0A428KE16_9BACT|nr:hypothetical protein [Hymenobacter perfusus]RSK44648.1 hypothetical protein EI293_09045 [Hymenobacter perfusus]